MTNHPNSTEGLSQSLFLPSFTLTCIMLSVSRKQAASSAKLPVVQGFSYAFFGFLIYAIVCESARYP